MPSAQSDDQAGHILADVLSGTQKAAHGTRQAVLGALSAFFHCGGSGHRFSFLVKPAFPLASFSLLFLLPHS
jgi:hypothetical protein